MVKEGTTIDIYQSIGKKKFEMSDYTGRRYDDVIRILENKSFKDISKNDVYDDSEPGTIIDQNFSDGEEVVPEETRLEFTVSKGPEFIILKDLRDLNAKGVQDYADSVGLKVDMSKEEYHDTIPKGFVISQVPKAGAQLVKGDTITVVLSKGKKEIPPKTVIKEITIPYEPTQEGQPQEVQIYVEDMTRSMAEPYETLYITETKKLSLDLIIESGKKSRI